MSAIVTGDPLADQPLIPTFVQPSVGIETRPNIPSQFVPLQDGNFAMPPRTNLYGPPSAFRDSISGTGGIPSSATTSDPARAAGPPSRLDLTFGWFERNRSLLLALGLGLLGFAAITRSV